MEEFIKLILSGLIGGFFAFQLEHFKSRHQLRMAALDKRLQAHQEAFSLWRELSSSIMNQKETMATALKCEDWWWKNCFYLDAEPREAFWEAFRSAPSDYHQLPREEKNEIRKIMDKAFSLLQESVKLPPIKDIKLDKFITKEEKG